MAKTRVRASGRPGAGGGRRLLLVAAALLAVVAVAAVVRQWLGDRALKPLLVVDTDSIDLGELPTGTEVTARFWISNEGTADLRLEPDPEVEVIEGC
ncbi:MAG: hypothetical protein ACYC5O_15560 [Anaerolineae bacterium]